MIHPLEWAHGALLQLYVALWTLAIVRSHLVDWGDDANGDSHWHAPWHSPTGLKVRVWRGRVPTSAAPISP